MEQALTEQDWQDYLNQTPRSLRALGVLQDRWQDVILDNPLFVSLITPADLMYAWRLAINAVVTDVVFPLATYADRQIARRHYGQYLTTEAVGWLNLSQTNFS